MAAPGVPGSKDWISEINEHIKTMRGLTTNKNLKESSPETINLVRFDKVCASKRDDLVDAIISEVERHIPEEVAEEVSNASLGLKCEVENHEEDAYGEMIQLLTDAVEDLTRRLKKYEESAKN